MRGYYLGCPAWGFKEWVGNLYRKGSKAGQYLEQYGSVFNTVEGNTTFYSLPSAESVVRWKDATPPEFRFCFKFPQVITHRKMLRHAARETEDFLVRMAPLGDRLGPFMLQLPPAFGPPQLRDLEAFVRALPPGYRYAVELRHASFYATEAAVRHVNDLLTELGCERVIIDTRPLRSGDPQHPGVNAARHRKPDLPVHPVALSEHPMVRFIGHPELETNRPWLESWCEIIADWIRDGFEPYVFVHSPDNTPAPRFARILHGLLQRQVDVGEMSRWPGESGQLSLL